MMLANLRVEIILKLDRREKGTKSKTVRQSPAWQRSMSQVASQVESGLKLSASRDETLTLMLEELRRGSALPKPYVEAVS
jgi:hypothetical protein